MIRDSIENLQIHFTDDEIIFIKNLTVIRICIALALGIDPRLVIFEHGNSMFS